MGKLEETNRKRTKRKNLQRIILKTVATAGILGVGLMAPQVVGALGKLGLLPNFRQKEYISSSASKMVKRGLLTYNGKYYQLTPEGERLLHRFQLSDFGLKKPKRWDKKWRAIISDIPESKKVIRDQIRQLLEQAGFRRLQDSVWVYPYDCEDVLTLLKTDLGVGKNILYLIVDELENDKHLREEFGLIS